MDRPRALIGAVGAFARRYLPDDGPVCVALSGGPDSLALTAASVRAGLTVEALVVDHELQSGSAEVASTAAAAAESLGAQARVLTVVVGSDGGLEAAARSARYEALEAARGDRPVLLGHTLDDQAETVLLGLARGSGPASLSGMREWRPPWGRPLLGLRRADTVAACAQWGLSPVDDPHNADPRFTRVRVRTEVLPLMEDVLGGGVAQALSRTADMLAADSEVLDELSSELLDRARGPEGLAVAELAAVPEALRTRALRRWLRDDDEVGELSSRVVAAVDALVVDWRGQGPVAVGGDRRTRRVVARRRGLLVLANVGRVRPRA
ncbi:MAG TPA: tRNA lysidine(34) synthetase TilS [Gordonia sp. (in: high G+C Gram-positive bacteria)]|uniref:tRNA lysidine(34) synthetase TilS n=1 Tax=unclassified Gordonia (in: high G+C Gram-positive bacteria) TaxID=2657482 RepID=UPI000FC2CB37|nr:MULTISPECIES: tRNA lysidine(34) synthetase TilS [unclassified Gordonia (in: high G+C Gram-positive bacteria)]RUP41216.1 MAG: tRNA lysidine(34) synthetase TilS [Gordonia sp. (in: high G+C Gram-positive bacteria)]HNP55589.1 tRNA lysidine(34) synthetase TilS [Gordonia sp. (in: high G+C Gram-positive bacteria)]HRC50490.1 tRNA lysidine(34) synthetase TilS [Gordonia sp. (in: high G+C Gram-positive bacteria)]